jgi:hypothetical protein
MSVDGLLLLITHGGNIQKTQRSTIYSLSESCNNVENDYSVGLSSNPSNYQRSQPINVRYHYVREVVQDNIIVIDYVLSAKNLADVLTKELSPPSS